MLENIKRRDPPILTRDEILVATEDVERVSNFLKEDIAVAKVILVYTNISNTNYRYL